VFIGTHMDKGKIVETLNACLLNEEEMAGGKDLWKKFENPFPESTSEESTSHIDSNTT
jgi:hypothetical protein